MAIDREAVHRGVTLLVSVCLATVAARVIAVPFQGAPSTTSGFRQLNPVTPLTAETFADPPQNDMSWVRWNFPPATATIAELETELQDKYDHNMAGVEIGQGGVPTTEQLVAIYKKATALGITVSLKAVNGLPGAATSCRRPRSSTGPSSSRSPAAIRPTSIGRWHPRIT